MMEVKNKKVTVVGLARSGVACANLLYELGSDVYITELSNDFSIKEYIEQLRSKNIKIELGKHTRDFIKGSSFIVVSPAVQRNSVIFDFAREFKIPVISELELAYQFCKGTIIAITGTNGKTTVTTLVSKIFESIGKKVFTLGNIGNPFSASVLNIKQKDYVILEVSSFQLENIIHFKPKVSVFLNFSPDHLDRYTDMDEYLQAKKNIFVNQGKDDFAVLNYQDPTVKSLSKQIQARILYFNTNGDLQLNNNALMNPNNQAVLAIANIFGIKKEACFDEFSKFRGIKHRLEHVMYIRGIEFINDSKATNIHSTIWALQNITKPIILIAGGKDKNCDYSQIRHLVNKKVKKLICFGQAKQRIGQALIDAVAIQQAKDLEEAVNVSFRQATAGDCILLSPMCSSFDSFKNFEHRGDSFKEIVSALY